MSVPVAIIDSGGANIASLRAALTRLGAESVVTSDTNVIQRATRVLLPGVGGVGGRPVVVETDLRNGHLELMWRDDLGEGKGVNLLFLRFVLVELA